MLTLRVFSDGIYEACYLDWVVVFVFVSFLSACHKLESRKREPQLKIASIRLACGQQVCGAFS